MKGKYLLRGIGGLALSALLVLGVTASTATTVNARGHTRVIIAPRVGFGFGRGYWGWRGYPYPYYGYYSQYVFGDGEAAESQGYHDGLKTGQDDEHHGRSFDPERSHYFKDAGFGNFADAYRDGFDRGYSDGFGR